VPAFLAPVDYAVGSFPTSVAVGDFNNDDQPDLVTANGGNDTVSVLRGNSDGTFQPAQTTVTGPWPQSLAVGDFNADGKLDLATANYDYALYYGGTGDNNVSILLGHGDGTFDPAILLDYGTNLIWSSIAPGDLNADGNLDLVVTSFESFGGSTAFVLLGHGNGSFAPVATYSLGSGGVPTAPVLEDFNSDGNADVAVAKWEGSVKLLLGNGDGTLQAPRDFATNLGAEAVAVGDFDADGELDLAVANGPADSVDVLLGNGDGTFQAEQSFAAGDDPRSVTAGDINGDGVLDLVATNVGSSPSYADGGLTVLFGNGDGSFALPITTAAGSTPDSVVVADFNADSLLDAAVAKSPSALSVYINDSNWDGSPPPPPPPPPVPSITINDGAVTEGNSGTASATFTVTLSNASNVDVTVHYATADISAAAGSDYTAASGTVFIPAGQTSATITVAVRGDRLGEADETFAVNLSAATGATIGDGQGIGTIIDNEPRISISDVTYAEGKKGKTTFTFTVTLSAAYDQPVTVSFQTVNGTATTGDDDYQARTGTITFKPGETTKTITIDVKGDSKKEAEEFFYVDLFGNSSNSVLDKKRGIGTILNDD
jgi:hypothetical protein